MIIKNIIFYTYSVMINIEFHKEDKYPNKSGKVKIIVPKKNVKLAVNRNKVKRQIRAILQKHKVSKGCVIFRDKQNATFEEIENSLSKLFQQK